MRKYMVILYRLVGRNPLIEKKIDEKRIEAHDLINESMGDVWKAKKEVDKINVKTSQKLNKVSKQLESISYKIGVATGGTRRGL